MNQVPNRLLIMCPHSQTSDISPVGLPLSTSPRRFVHVTKCIRTHRVWKLKIVEPIVGHCADRQRHPQGHFQLRSISTFDGPWSTPCSSRLGLKRFKRSLRWIGAISVRRWAIPGRIWMSWCWCPRPVRESVRESTAVSLPSRWESYQHQNRWPLRNRRGPCYRQRWLAERVGINRTHVDLQKEAIRPSSGSVTQAEDQLNLLWHWKLLRMFGRLYRRLKNRREQLGTWLAFPSVRQCTRLFLVYSALRERRRAKKSRQLSRGCSDWRDGARQKIAKTPNVSTWRLNKTIHPTSGRIHHVIWPPCG